QDFDLNPLAERPRNFREWVVQRFGEGIAKHFMVPYNEKLLGVSLDELRPEYAERFIPRPSLEDVVKGALGFSRESLGYNAKFVYPREGGISALPRALSRSLSQPPRYNITVQEIDLANRTATLSDGTQLRYDHLLNSSPLPRFLELLKGLPEEIRSVAR